MPNPPAALVSLSKTSNATVPVSTIPLKRFDDIVSVENSWNAALKRSM